MDFVIAVDFDATCVKHKYPEVGEDVPGAADWLKAFHEAGANLILNTMRSDDRPDGKTLEAAINWFEDNDIPLFGVNHNPTQDDWTSSPKVYAHLYIDDAAFGCPLVNLNDGSRPYVDWSIVGPSVMQMMSLMR